MLGLRQKVNRGSLLEPHNFEEDFEAKATKFLENPELTPAEHAETLYELGLYRSAMTDEPNPELFRECMRLAREIGDTSLECDANRRLGMVLGWLQTKRLHHFLASQGWDEAQDESRKAFADAYKLAAENGDVDSAVAIMCEVGVQILEFVHLLLVLDPSDEDRAAEVMLDGWDDMEACGREMMQNEQPGSANPHNRDRFDRLAKSFYHFRDYHKNMRDFPL